jgi:acyl phosphate:glycerol-3-phosphate acyltransferase
MYLDIAVCVFAYLLGSLSSAVILCKIAGLPDPRSEGSGNPGATNVLRIGGKKLAALVLAGDLLKGLLPVLVAQLLLLPPLTVALAGLLAFVGHLFPIFFGFKGGKGVATALGALLGFAWPVGIALVMIWLGMALVFRISSLAAISAAVAAPVAMWLAEPGAWEYIAATLAMSLLLLWRHRSNIRNLSEGTEPTIGDK